MPLLAAIYGCSGTINGDPIPSNAGSPGVGGVVGASGSSSKGGGSSVGGAGGGVPTAGTSNPGGSGSGGASGSPATGGTGVVPPVSGEPLTVSMEGAPIYSRFLRLTNAQWDNAVRDILQLSASTGLSEDFLEPVSGTTDFDNNERVVVVDSRVWADMQLAAETMADRATATDADLQRIFPGTDPAAFIQTFGRRAFRRDLTAAEVASFQDVYTAGSTSPIGTQSAFTKGVSWVIAAMLQSPHFLYRTELGDNGAPLTGYEMAAKLSLWLRDTTPSDALLDAAESGALDTAEGAATQATTMLEEAASAAVMREFHGELYKLALYDTVSKDNVPGYTPALNAELKEASYLFFERIYSQNLGVRDMLTSEVGFAGSGLASLYGVAVQGSAVQQVNLPGRLGYYSQAPFLTIWAINSEPDSIRRGVRINLDTLCADPGLPSEDLPPIPPLNDGETNRQRITTLTGVCGAVCHGEIINPIGFAYEDMDGLGRFRDLDNGQVIDTTGAYPFAEGVTSFADSTQLMQLIANGSQAHQCYAKKLTSFATSRDLVERERPLIESLGAVSQASGSSVKQVALALVRNDAFRTHVGGTP